MTVKCKATRATSRFKHEDGLGVGGDEATSSSEGSAPEQVSILRGCSEDRREASFVGYDSEDSGQESPAPKRARSGPPALAVKHGTKPLSLKEGSGEPSVQHNPVKLETSISGSMGEQR